MQRDTRSGDFLAYCGMRGSEPDIDSCETETPLAAAVFALDSVPPRALAMAFVLPPARCFRRHDIPVSGAVTRAG